MQDYAVKDILCGDLLFSQTLQFIAFVKTHNCS